MRLSMRSLIAAVVVVLAAGVASTAAAQTQVYDWADSNMPALVKNDSGLIFITKDKRPHRVYRWDADNEPKGAQTVYIVDLDKTGSFEIVGTGKPTFALQSNSDPMWALKKGCDQTILADFVADDKLDLLCNNGRTMKVYTYDGQFVWEVGLGRRIAHCRAGDYNGDLKADLDCKYRSGGKWARVESTGDVLQKEMDGPEIDEDAIDLDEASPTGDDLLAGKTHFDLDGDGAADERITAEGKALVIGSKARDKAIGRVELDGKAEAGLVKDLDGDGKKEIVAVTEKTIFILSHDGKKKKSYPASANKFDRVPFAKLNSVYANNFEDNAKAQKVVDGLQDKLSQCYAKQVRRNQFAGTGQLILQVNVSEKGKVSGVNKIHTDLADDSIVKCAKKVLKRGDFPKATGTGSINVNMKYTFLDE